jgi:hypothetical protein
MRREEEKTDKTEKKLQNHEASTCITRAVPPELA